MIKFFFRVPVGGDARLECKIVHLGDFMQVWKNGTRVISVGSLQVNSALLEEFKWEFIRIDAIIL